MAQGIETRLMCGRDPDTTLLLDTLAATESYADAVMTITCNSISGDTATVTVAGP